MKAYGSNNNNDVLVMIMIAGVYWAPSFWPGTEQSGLHVLSVSHCDTQHR